MEKLQVLVKMAAQSVKSDRRTLNHAAALLSLPLVAGRLRCALGSILCASLSSFTLEPTRWWEAASAY
ncbi:MAG: hypothetical protein C4293_18770 [Nitrospiraceae bacterium]